MADSYKAALAPETDDKPSAIKLSLNCRGAKEEKIQRILKGGDPHGGEDLRVANATFIILRQRLLLWSKRYLDKVVLCKYCLKEGLDVLSSYSVEGSLVLSIVVNTVLEVELKSTVPVSVVDA